MRFVLCMALALPLLGGCKASYPKESLDDSVQRLFQKELGVEVRHRLVGKTLYVAFEIENLVSENFDLPKEVADKLESAMLSIARITLSTDADIDFTVIEALDKTWGVETVLVRRADDLKDLIYWRISREDFDERLILETRKLDPEAEPVDEWHDITLPEFMSRLVASRISMGSRINPFIGVLLGIEKMTARYDEPERTVRLEVDGYGGMKLSSSTASMDFLRNSVEEQMSKAEKKYLRLLTDKDWAGAVLVQNMDGEPLLRIEREDWSRKENRQIR